MQKRFTLFLSLLFFASGLLAQSPNEPIDLENFNADILKRLLTDRMNQYRVENGMDTFMRLDVLQQAAENQAEYMAEITRATDEQKVSSRSTTAKRVEYFGGSGKPAEVVGYGSAGKGREMATYKEAADEIFEKMAKSRKNEKILQDPQYIYGNVAVALNAERKKIYMSVTMGGIDVLNAGKQLRKQLPAKYTKNQRWLRFPEGRECRNVEKFDNLSKLYSGLRQDGRDIYLEYDDIKGLRKLIRADKAGFTIELIQPEQYACSTPNIYDNELVSKGILLKPAYSKKLFKNNDPDAEAEKRYYGKITRIPNRFYKKLEDGYEMNLVIVQDKKVCRSIPRAYAEMGGQESMTPLSIYPDTTTQNDAKRYKPVPEQNELTFNIPFKKGKYDYDPTDIKPFIEALDEPEFIIDEINIIAHSSIEGDSLQNEKLQRKRAESILKAIQTTQKKKVETKIQTSDSWDMFKEQIKADKDFAHLANKPKSEVKKELAKPGMLKKLEPVLSKERFAKITMKVTYDIEGENEEPFVLSNIKKAIQKKDAAKALRVQKYAIRQIEKGRYDHKKLLEIEVPKEEPYASLHVNNIYVDTRFNREGRLYPELQAKFDSLNKFGANNDFVKFNRLLTFIKFEEEGLPDVKTINEVQAQINGLYNSKAPQNLVDELNLEYQFMVIEAVDTASTGENDLVEQSMERIKKIFNLEEATWQNALKLAYIFIRHGDYNFAMNTLKPFVQEEENVDEELLFTYISLAAQDAEEMYASDFRAALTKAKDRNPERYCDLFSTPYLTFQLLDHPVIKQQYCESCGDIVANAKKAAAEVRKAQEEAAPAPTEGESNVGAEE